MVSNKVIYFTIKFLLFSLLLCSKPPTTISRSFLNDHDQLQKTKTSSKSSIRENVEDFLKDHGYSVGAVKSSGPSSRGAGHKVRGLPSLRTLKDSGPSPGEGHKVRGPPSRQTLKDSGPSPGTGHKVKGLPSLRTLKDSGPSPGVGHKSVTTNHH